MKKYAYISLFLCFFALLASCGDNPVAPVSDDETKIFNLSKVNCSTPEYSSQSVPVDCYEWGISEWPGDDNNFSMRAIQGWMHAAPIDTASPVSRRDLVEVDYMVLMEIDDVTKEESIVDSLNYTGPTRSLTYSEGGLYDRWYKYPAYHKTLHDNAEIDNGRLKVWPSMVKYQVSHWWMNPLEKYNRKLGKSYYLIVRLRVTGDIAVQLGADYYPDIKSGDGYQKEAFHSNWIGDTGRKFIEVCFPNRKE